MSSGDLTEAPAKRIEADKVAKNKKKRSWKHKTGAPKACVLGLMADAVRVGAVPDTATVQNQAGEEPCVADLLACLVGRALVARMW
jgi:hypothetical protein